MTSPRFATVPGRLPGVGHPLAFGPRPVLVPAEQVLRDPRTFDQTGPYSDRFRRIFGTGLFTFEHEQHSRHRRPLRPLFHRERIAEYARVMGLIAELTDTWYVGRSSTWSPR